MTIEEAKEMIKHILEVIPKEPPTECDNVEEWLYEDGEIRKALDMAIKALEQESSEDCEDTVSKTSVFEILGNLMSIPYDFDRQITEKDVSESMDKIRALPPVQPNPKTGHWIKVHPLQADDEGAYMCSCCEVGDWDLKGTEKFCPNCKARMIESQESEGKE